MRAWRPAAIRRRCARAAMRTRWRPRRRWRSSATRKRRAEPARSDAALELAARASASSPPMMRPSAGSSCASARARRDATFATPRPRCAGSTPTTPRPGCRRSMPRPKRTRTQSRSIASSPTWRRACVSISIGIASSCSCSMRSSGFEEPPEGRDRFGFEPLVEQHRDRRRRDRPAFAPLTEACRESAAATERREFCQKIAKNLQQGDTIVAQLAGLSVERHFLPADSKESRALGERRRVLEWRIASAEKFDAPVLPWLKNAHARWRVADAGAAPRGRRVDRDIERTGNPH
jgi:hypothetical protein